MLKKLHTHQTGDTIIEVLLALAVTVTVLTSAYVIANRALKIGRLAEERTQATKLAQGQIEVISAFARASDPNAPLGDPAHKLKNLNIPNDPLGAAPSCMQVWSPTWSTSQVVTSGLASCTYGLYTVSIAREVFPGGYSLSTYGGQFRVVVTWPSLNVNSSSQDEQVEIHYRAYEGI